MSQAEELLNSLTDDIPVHVHPVTDSDTYFIIDPISRAIENTARKKNTLMQYDHGSEVFTFELPRYVEGHDMILCNRVLVHWNNIDGETGEENAEATDIYDLQVDPNNEDNVICSWEITRNSTQLVGILSFLLQYMCVDDEGNATYEWHTDIYEGIEIKKTRRNGEASVIEYTDILEQWRQRLFGAGESVMADISSESATQIAAIKSESEKQQNIIETMGTAIQTESETQQKAIEAKGAEVLATIPEDYTTTYRVAEESLRTRANAITLDSEGEAISLSDSSGDHIRGLNLYGKSTQFTTTGVQLFNAYAERNESFANATIENNGAKITVTGAYYVSWPITLKAGVEYYIDFTVSGNTEYRAVRFEYPDKEITNTITNPATFTPLYDTVSVYLYAGLGTEGTVVYDNVQINEGSSALPWEPYTGGVASPNPEYPQEIVSIENPTIYVYGKNLYSLGDVVLDGNSRAETIFTGPIKTPVTLSWIQDFTRSTGSALFGYVVDGVWYYTAANETPGRHVTPITNEGILEKIMLLNWATESGNLTDIQIEVGESATEFESYKSAQSLTLNRTIPGIPVPTNGNYTDSNGQQWICDEIDFERGVYIQRIIRKTFSASVNEAWRSYNIPESSTHTAYQESKLCSDIRVFSGLSEEKSWLLSNKYTSVPLGNIYTNGTQGVAVSNTTPVIRICVDECRGYSVDEFKAWLADNPFDLVYPLATPIETELTTEEIMAYKALRTNYPNTTVLNNQNAYMAIGYNADTEIFLRDNQPKPTDEQVQAAVEEYAAKNGIQVPSDDHINTLIYNVLEEVANGSY